MKYLSIPEKIQKYKRIKFEGKLIYSYIFIKGFEKFITHLNIGELQPYLKIKNKGLKNNLKKLELCNYLIYKEYAPGLYEIHLSR